jgi:hypothetical protein
VKNAFALRKKEPKTRQFQPLKNATVPWGQLLAYFNGCPLRFYDDFSCQKHQAMLIHKGNCFDTCALVLVSDLPKITKTVFFSLSLDIF